MNKYMNYELIQTAMSYLEMITKLEVDSVSINTYKLDDGTLSLDITVNFPKGVEKKGD